MNRPTFISLLLIFFISHFKVSSQILQHYNDFDLYWGESFRDLGNVERILNTKDDDYISVINRTTLFNFFSDYKKRFYFEPIRSLRPERQKKIKLYGNGERAYLEDFAVLEDNLFIISRKKKPFKKEVSLYYHFMDPDRLVTENHGFYLNSYSLKRSFAFGFLSVTNNLKKSYVGYLHTLPGGRNDFPTYSFGVFDSTYRLKMHGTSMFPYRYREMRFTESFITDEGSLYVLAEEFTDNHEMNWGADNFRKQLTVFKLKDGELTNFNVENDQLLIKEIKLYADGENLIFSGLYAEDLRSGIRGVFFIRMDNDGKIIQEEYTRFSSDFLIQGQQIPQNLLNGNPEILEGLGSYKMKNLRQTSDGGYIGIAEHYDEEDRFSGTGAPGTSNRIDTYYYYNNILVYKFDSSGRLLWNTYVPKNQHSINDGGYFLSYASYLQDSSLFLIFNDNSRNYNEDGAYNFPVAPHTAYFNSWRNTVAMVKINLITGEVVRKSIGGKRLTDTVLVPKLCIENQEVNELFLYGKSGNRHRYGRIKFTDY